MNIGCENGIILKLHHVNVRFKRKNTIYRLKNIQPSDEK